MVYKVALNKLSVISYRFHGMVKERKCMRTQPNDCGERVEGARGAKGEEVARGGRGRGSDGG